MSNLLINEQPLQVLPGLAVKIGLNEAIFLQQLHYWLERSNNIRNGHKWVYNTVADWSKQFPFWSSKTISRTVSSLEKQELILSGNFNNKGYDRTKWYTIDYAHLELLERKNEEEKTDKNQNDKQENNVKNEQDFSVQPIRTDCPNETEQGIESQKSEKTLEPALMSKSLGQNDQSIKTNCPHPLGQNDQMDQDNLSSPIPRDYSSDYTENTTRDREKREKAKSQTISVDIKTVIDLFQNDIHPLCSKTESDNLLDLCYTYSPFQVMRAINLAKQKGGKSINYIAAILANNQKGGRYGTAKQENTSAIFNTGQNDKKDAHYGHLSENDKLWQNLPD